MKKTSSAVLAVVLAFPALALADISGTATIAAGGNFNLDVGTNVSSGGDISFTGTSIAFVGSAKGASLFETTGSATYNSISQTVVQTLLSLDGSAAPISTSALTAGSTSGSIIVVGTNGGNVAKLLITVLSSSSITFQYTTYESATTGGGSPGASAPAVTNILNNSSTIPAGFTNSGVAPSSIVQIQGSAMATPGSTAVLQQVYPSGSLPSTLNGTTVSVTVGGTTVHPAFYYSEPSQLAIELPANTPTGTGTLTVSYGGQSVNSPITVVAAAFGIDVYDGNYAVLQDSVSGAIITPTNSAKPGETVTLWGTGLGADTADSDVNYSSSPHQVSTPIQLYIGSTQVPASAIAYSGSLGYPGVSGIVFTVPSSVSSGCFVSIAVVTNGNTVSNTPVASFMPSGGVCTDSYTGLTGTTISTLTGSANYSEGFVDIGQVTSPGIGGGSPTTIDAAIASFEQVSGSYTISTSGTVSEGSCSLSQGITGTGTSTITETGLNAGTITVTPPGGSAVTLQSISEEPGFYEAELSSGAIPTSGGTFTFSGSGGSGTSSVGSFSTTVNFPNPILSWTNQSSAATVVRSSGITYQWSGGAPGSFVVVTGSSSSGTATGSYSCIFPQSALQGTVPSYILLGLPAGTGTSGIENSTSFNSFSASGLNYGYALGFVSVSINSTYQ